MHLFQARARAALCLVAALCLLCGNASAITPNDIRTWYGVGLKQDVRPLLAQADEVAQNIRTAESLALYNKVLSQYPSEQLQQELTEYSVELAEISNILQAGIDLPLEEILSMEQRYFALRTEADTVAQTLDVVGSLHTYDNGEDVDALKESLTSLEKAIQTAGYYDDIGKLGVWPVLNVKRNYNSNFGTRWDPVTNKSYSYHSGVDLYAPMNTTVVAEFSGTVYRAGYSVSSGNYIYLDHGHGVRTFYCHLSTVNVSTGKHVTQGTPIALSGNTGTRTTGPHLHFGIYIDGKAVDPKVVLDRG